MSLSGIAAPQLARCQGRWQCGACGLRWVSGSCHDVTWLRLYTALQRVILQWSHPQRPVGEGGLSKVALPRPSHLRSLAWRPVPRGCHGNLSYCTSNSITLSVYCRLQAAGDTGRFCVSEHSQCLPWHLGLGRCPQLSWTPENSLGLVAGSLGCGGKKVAS